MRTIVCIGSNDIDPRDVVIRLPWIAPIAGFGKPGYTRPPSGGIRPVRTDREDLGRPPFAADPLRPRHDLDRGRRHRSSCSSRQAPSATPRSFRDRVALAPCRRDAAAQRPAGGHAARFRVQDADRDLGVGVTRPEQALVRRGRLVGRALLARRQRDPHLPPRLGHPDVARYRHGRRRAQRRRFGLPVDRRIPVRRIREQGHRLVASSQDPAVPLRRQDSPVRRRPRLPGRHQRHGRQRDRHRSRHPRWPVGHLRQWREPLGRAHPLVRRPLGGAVRRARERPAGRRGRLVARSPSGPAASASCGRTRPPNGCCSPRTPTARRTTPGRRSRSSRPASARRTTS